MSKVIGQEIGKATQAFKFGAIEFKTHGYGVFFASEKLKARIQALTPDELRAANKAAWKQRRAAERGMERSSCMSLWDGQAHDYSVAKDICNLTWRVLNGAAILNCGGVGRKLVPPAGPCDAGAQS